MENRHARVQQQQLPILLLRLDFFFLAEGTNLYRLLAKYFSQSVFTKKNGQKILQITKIKAKLLSYRSVATEKSSQNNLI